MTPQLDFAERVGSYFERVHREVFADDPAANPFLSVEVVDSFTAHDSPAVLLITPWTLCGLVAPPDGRFPTSLRVGHTHHPALGNEVDALGSYWSVVLIPDVSGYPSQEEARSAALGIAGDFRDAVTAARRALTEVADEDRRELFRQLGGSQATSRPGTGFGSPHGQSGRRG